MKPEATDANFTLAINAAEAYNAVPARDRFSELHWFEATLPNAAAINAVQTSSTDVLFIEHNRTTCLTGAPSEAAVPSRTTAATSQYNLDRIDERRPFDVDGDYTPYLNGDGVPVYMLDTGSDPSAGQVGPGATFAPLPIPTPEFEDTNGHGTHVAGIVGNSTYGVAKSAELVPVKVFHGNVGTVAQAIAGINFVMGAHADDTPAVATIGVSAPSAALQAATGALVGDGVTVVVGSGNTNSAACTQAPANAAGAIVVGASDANDDRWVDLPNGSSTGCVDIYAPGADIASIDSGLAPCANPGPPGVCIESGTSMAAAHVAGAAAMYLQEESVEDATPAEVSQALLDLATPDVVGNGPGPSNLLLFIPSFVTMEIEKESDPTAVKAGAPYKYIIRVTTAEDSPHPAQTVTIQDDLPPGVEYLDYEPKGIVECGIPAMVPVGGIVTCKGLGPLAPGTSAEVTLTVRAPNSPGSVFNRAFVLVPDSIPTEESDDSSELIETTVELPQTTGRGPRPAPPIYRTDPKDPYGTRPWGGQPQRP